MSDKVTKLKDVFLPGYQVEPDKTPVEYLITNFRQHFAQFFGSTVPMENAPVQMDTTQVYRNILEFRRNRLRRLGLVCNYESKRMGYVSSSGVTATNSFDGKYEITEAKEQIAARTTYLKDGRKIYSRTDNQIARYTILNAKQTDQNTIICPNCGAQATREDLIDGCDHCGTRFIVEDLGMKVSDFGYRADYDLLYGRYKEFRKRLSLWIGLAIFLVTLCWSSYWAVTVSGDAAVEAGAGPVLKFFAILFSALFPAAAFTFLGLCFFNILIFPFIQGFASAMHISMSMMSKLKKSASNDNRIQSEIRRHDKLFSVNQFYSGVQNKLASLHFAETPNQINAFTTFDLSYMLESYRNVVDMDTQYISLKNYYIDKQSGLQVAEVEADLQLTEFDGTKCKTRNEKLMLMMSKSAACKTQAICGPSLMRCRGCGMGITLLNGRVCPQCGTDIYLERYDWVIRGYKLVK